MLKIISVFCILNDTCSSAVQHTILQCTELSAEPERVQTQNNNKRSQDVVAESRRSQNSLVPVHVALL